MARLERQITVAAVVLPFLGFIVALWLLWGGAVTGLDLAILAVMYVLVGFGVTIGFHRLFTHRSFEAKPWLRGTLAILGSMSVQGAVIHWVADHRKHHTFTDEEGDPHSPHTHDAPGWRGVLQRPLALAHGLAVRRRALVRAPLRAGPAQGPADPHDRHAVPGLGAARPRDPGRRRLHPLRLRADRRR